jgi:hypothetical protein
VAANGAVGAAEVAWFPGFVQRAEGVGNVLGELGAGGVNGLGEGKLLRRCAGLLTTGRIKESPLTGGTMAEGRESRKLSNLWNFLVKTDTISIQVHRRRRIVTCVPTQTQGCQPMIINPKMFLRLKSPSSLDLFALIGSTRWHKLASDSGDADPPRPGSTGFPLPCALD